MSQAIQYVSLMLTKVLPEKALPGDLYLFVNGHFLKYKGLGDSLPRHKFESFLAQKLQYVFVEAGDLEKFLKWANETEEKTKEAIVKEVGEENRDVVEKVAAIKDSLFAFVTGEVTEKSVREMLDKSRDFINTVKQKKTAERFMAKIMSYNQTVGDHSTNVANLSVFLAMNIGYTQQTMLENIFNGALLHDFGKTRVNTKYLDDPNSKEAQNAMKKHPDLGKTALLLDSGFPDEVLRIIAEHHERQDGKGFPKGLKGAKIYELTKIVSFANEFDNIVMNSEGDVKARQKMAFKKLEEDQGKIFDPKILGKCLRALEPMIMK